MQNMVWTRALFLKAAPEQLWPAISDTDAFNRASGLPPVAFRSFPQDFGSRREGAFRILGIRLTWDEYPFEFQEPHRLSVFRSYHSGPIHELENIITLEPHGTGTKLVHTIRVLPRHAGGRLIAWIQIGLLTIPAFDRVLKMVDQGLTTGRRPYVEKPALGEGRRTEISQALGGLEDSGHLVDHLVAAPSHELMNMRPFRLANVWKITRQQAITLFLEATQTGVLDAKWVLICPQCRGVSTNAMHLQEIRFDAHCESCNVGFTAEFDNLTELVFDLAPRFRTFEVADYCVGGPGRMPHVAAQARVQPGKTTALALSLPTGAYRIRSSSTSQAVLVEVAQGGLTETALTISADTLGPGSLVLGNPCRVTIANPTHLEALVSIERTAWADDACPASYVTTLQKFRDLFGRETLAAGLAVKISHVALLFTDLKDSTALYKRTGDAAAFGLVHNHFGVLTEVIRKHEGAVVKTIGDAVMAVFSDSKNALRAAIAVHEAVASLRTADDQPVVLKVGLHAGACFAVTAGETLDYFGSTVNLAARIQSQSLGGDVVIAASLAEEPAIAGILGARARSTFSANLKGIGEEIELARIEVATNAPIAPT